MVTAPEWGPEGPCCARRDPRFPVFLLLFVLSGLCRSSSQCGKYSFLGPLWGWLTSSEPSRATKATGTLWSQLHRPILFSSQHPYYVTCLCIYCSYSNLSPSLTEGELCVQRLLPAQNVHQSLEIWGTNVSGRRGQEKGRGRKGKKRAGTCDPHRCNHFSLVWCPQHVVFTVYTKSLQWHLTLCDSMTCSPPGSSVPEIPRQENWSGLPFPSPGDLHHVFGLFLPPPNWSSWLWISLSLQHRALNN